MASLPCPLLLRVAEMANLFDYHFGARWPEITVRKTTRTSPQIGVSTPKTGKEKGPDRLLYQGRYQLAKETKWTRYIPRQIALYLFFSRLVPLSGHDLDILPISGL